MMDPNHFLMIMLSRFELYQIFSTPDYGKRFSSEVTHKVRTCITRPRMLRKPLLSGYGHPGTVCSCSHLWTGLPAGCRSAEQHSDRGDAVPHHHACRWVPSPASKMMELCSPSHPGSLGLGEGPGGHTPSLPSGRRKDAVAEVEWTERLLGEGWWGLVLSRNRVVSRAAGA